MAPIARTEKLGDRFALKATLAESRRRSVSDVARSDHRDFDVGRDGAAIDSLVLDETQSLLEVLEEVSRAKCEDVHALELRETALLGMKAGDWTCARTEVRSDAAEEDDAADAAVANRFHDSFPDRILKRSIVRGARIRRNEREHAIGAAKGVREESGVTGFSRLRFGSFLSSSASLSLERPSARTFSPDSRRISAILRPVCPLAPMTVIILYLLSPAPISALDAPSSREVLALLAWAEEWLSLSALSTAGVFKVPAGSH